MDSYRALRPSFGFRRPFLGPFVCMHTYPNATMYNHEMTDIRSGNDWALGAFPCGCTTLRDSSRGSDDRPAPHRVREIPADGGEILLRVQLEGPVVHFPGEHFQSSGIGLKVTLAVR